MQYLAYLFKYKTIISKQTNKQIFLFRHPDGQKRPFIGYPGEPELVSHRPLADWLKPLMLDRSSAGNKGDGTEEGVCPNSQDVNE